jgi:hypothetical protein
VHDDAIYFPFLACFPNYYRPPDVPDTAGELRIRLTSGSDPRSFDDGVDLIQHGGLWHFPLIFLAGLDRYAGICGQLLRDRLVTSELRPNAGTSFRN